MAFYGMCQPVTGAVNANNMASWGECFAEVLFGDPVLNTVAILAILAYVAYKLNLPHEVSLTLGVGLVFTVAMVYSSDTMNALVAVSIVVFVVYLGRGLIKPAKK